MKLSHARVALSLLAALGASQAHAQLLNISTNALQSQRTPAVACTIISTIGNSVRGMKVVVAAAEANSAGSNPRLRAELLENGEVMSNDTWTGAWVGNGTVFPALPLNTFPALLRAPNGANDAALLISVPLGWRLCVTSEEESGGDTLRRVSLAVTDVTDAFIRNYGKSADHPLAVKEVPVGTPNVMNMFARMAGTP